MTLPAQVHIPDGVMARQVAEEIVILDLASGNYYGLDAVGARIWSLLTAGKTPAEVLQTVVEEFDVAPEEFERDLLKLLHELKEKGLVSLH